MNKNDFLLAVHEYLKAFGYTSLDFVISEVLSRLNINSLEELKTIEPEAYAFIVSLENGSNELEVVP